MPTRATRKGATAAKRAPKKTPAKVRASKPQVTAPPDPALPLKNAQHERFAIEYQKDLNGTQAYLRSSDGVGAASAATLAWRMLRKVEIAARVQYLHRQAMQSLDVEAKVEAKEVLQGMVRVAKADIRKVINQAGAALPVHEWPDDVAMAVASVEIFEEHQGRGKDREIIGYTKKFRFNDRVAALGQLGKHLRLFTEKVELTGPNGGAIPVQSLESPEQKAALAAVRKRLGELERRGKDEK